MILTPFFRVGTSAQVCENFFQKFRWRDNFVTAYLIDYFKTSNLVCQLKLNYVIDDDEPWCFTTDPNTEYDYCDVPKCGQTTAAPTTISTTTKPTPKPRVTLERKGIIFC